ncbi:F-box/RNI/FBD-like domain protein, partial [Trifolium medium]|nr:F-box/RNI/FBD-like domain protein [Trifolium medium]
MSFLPTINSIATMSLVSPMWRNLWKHLQVFDFTYSWPGNFKKFAFYVNAVLSLRKSRDIRKMHLFCDIDEDFEFNGNCVDMWIRAAIGPRLEELSLMICTYNGDQRFLLSPSLFLDCTNLVSLSLSGEIQMKVQHSSVHFPSLKSLTLDFDIVDSEVALLSGCPILERLDLHFGPTSLIEAPVPPSSKRLKFTYDNFAWTYLEIFPDAVIDERITLGILGNLQSMVESYLDIFS